MIHAFNRKQSIPLVRYGSMYLAHFWQLLLIALPLTLVVMLAGVAAVVVEMEGTTS